MHSSGGGPLTEEEEHWSSQDHEMMTRGISVLTCH